MPCCVQSAVTLHIGRTADAAMASPASSAFWTPGCAPTSRSGAARRRSKPAPWPAPCSKHETWAFTEILNSYLNAGLQSPTHYFRNKDQREIDLLIEADGRLYPVECKKSASPGPDALAAGRSLQQLGVAVGSGAVVCLVPQAVPLSSKPRLTAVPALWL